jgi:uncharacterized membrane protein YciS (DUF1049 family)
MMTLFLIGWAYAVVGLVAGFLLFAFYVIHAERCDRCVFGYDIADWKKATLLSKIGVVFSIGSAITWPLAILYTLFVALPALACEKLFARAEDNSLQSIVRAWYKRNRKKGWQIHISDDESGKKKRKVTVQIYHSDPTASIKISDDKCELEWNRGTFSPSPKTDAVANWVRRSLSPGNPEFFNLLKKFMKDINAGREP